MFEGFSASPEDTLTAAIKLAREWNTEVKKETHTSHRSLPLQVQSPPDAIVIRTDAAWSSVSTNAGLGWVTISRFGIQSYKESVTRVASPLAAEGLALREAVRTCVNAGMKMVAFESDCLQLIKAVKSEVTIMELYSVVADIISYVSVFEFVSFSWISREKNAVADRLAKDALIVSEPMVVGDAVNAPN